MGKAASEAGQWETKERVDKTYGIRYNEPVNEDALGLLNLKINRFIFSFKDNPDRSKTIPTLQEHLMLSFKLSHENFIHPRLNTDIDYSVPFS